MSELGVVHLVREQNGIEPFRAFLESYRQHDAGTKHDLLILFKGFKDNRVPDEYRGLLENLQYQTLFLSDAGYDLGAYVAAARNFNHKFFCFLNSYSVIHDNDWLAKMHRYIVREDVGLGGATGSYESHYSNQLSLFRGMLPANIKPASFNRLRETSLKSIKLARWRAYFKPFPNYHIRTNAFMIKRDLFLKLKNNSGQTKLECFKFESGRRSMTQQIMAMNLIPLIVGQDGLAYEKERWRESKTFRSGAQSNLLVADNRTNEYQVADAESRRLMEELTWGKPVRGQRSAVVR